ncbi:hypothetical protein [Pseudomonas sp. PDM20]|uniref:hypothetical protein n=1 Tax=Pseudomonas sp. PDM20 TaxID=2769254 RepID=UPI00177F9324|nr:hypothetical protein [Pseudomonas sp. PDM20]MBD9685244.1 hypothetical protein [Pseudomonas sp. PDM20]
MSRRVWVVLCLLLAGCANQPQPEPRTVRVEVAVPVPCRAPVVDRPAWATATLKPGDDLQTTVRALLAERLQRIGYKKKLEAAVLACQ